MLALADALSSHGHMTLIRVQPEWMLSTGDGRPRTLNDVMSLLTAVEQEKNLSRACAKLKLSYRHAWGLIQRASHSLGAPLLHSVRGQGASLSALGERLVWANRRVSARLSPLLDTIASELEVEISHAIAKPTNGVRIHGSHSFALDAFRDHLRELRVPLELRYCGSEDALASLGQSTCDIAGFHTPVGDLEIEFVERWRKWLRPRAQTLINFVTRRQGIIVAAGNPKRVLTLGDLTRQDVRFVNRQRGSGTRLLVDLLLQRESIDCRLIAGFDSMEFTHAAVAAYIASGMGDAGIGLETAARLFALDFVPLLEERYFLACRTDAIDSRHIKALRDILRSREFRTRLSLLPGVSANACGTTVSMTDAYPQLSKKRRRATKARRQPATIQ
jgi:molybdate transport repressor ModE-like protein